VAEADNLRGQQMAERLQKLAQDWGDGRVTLREIVGLTDEELYAIATQGYLLFLQGKNEQARVIFEGLVSVDPRNAYYYRALGAVYFRLGQSAKAIRQFTYAIRVAPTEMANYINRAEVYVGEQDLPKARADLQHSLRYAGENNRPLEAKARAMLRML
jgi:Flp pilus assembly protein TadD